MINISYTQAYKIVITTIHPLAAQTVPLQQTIVRATADDIRSLLDSPSADVSLKDGFAVCAADIEKADPDNPITLQIIGSQFAGNKGDAQVESGKAVKITSGAVIPPGADGVLANEFAQEEGSEMHALAPVGNNILRKGTDVRKGEVVLPRHTTIMPTQAGLLAAAGHAEVPVYRKPRVTIIATGDEIVAVGNHVGTGKVAASNIVTISAWCTYFSMESRMVVVKDSKEDIAAAIQDALEDSDSIVTSGGAWRSERDLVINVLDELGWKKMFYRVKIGPGKAIGFGLLGAKPVFCLPGGPPSNQMAFLQIALPGLHCLGGHKPQVLPLVPAVLEETVTGQIDWTQFIMGMLIRDDASLRFQPKPLPSRLQMLSSAEGILAIPEGTEELPAGSSVMVQVMGLPHQVLC